MQDQTLNIARTHDPDRFLLSLLCPNKHRPALWALIAFNYEVAKTAEVVTEPITGKIRLQWWRDAIEEIYADEQPRRHEVVEPLANVIKKYDLKKDDLLAMINVREFDLEYKPLADWESFEIYARKCNENFNKLALKILGQKEKDNTINSVSFYYGAMGLIRTIPHQLSRRHLIFPVDMLETENLSMQKILDFKKEKSLQPIVQSMLERLEGVRSVKTQSRFLKAQQSMATLYHRRLIDVQGDVFDPKTHYPIPFLALRLLIKNILR
ncbi:MAG: squalene/phytoene synthase family protein [Pseudomonadota bacterium]